MVSSSMLRNTGLFHNDEIRLLTIWPELDHDGVLQCHLEKVSLLDLTDEYREFETQGSPDTSSSNWLENWYWYKCQISPREHLVEGEDDFPIYPPNYAHRFQWGDFAALSYMWGDPTNSKVILVNGVEVPVTVNLANALEMFRSSNQFSQSFKLWVDALCINQADVAERQVELGKMKRIYSFSWSVVAFLGNAADESDKALDLVDKIAKLHGNKQACEHLRDSLLGGGNDVEAGSWLALNKLTLRPYWERLWIIQELALGSRRTQVFIGSRSMNWFHFCRGLEVFHLYLWEVKTLRVQEDRRAKDPADDKRWERTGPLHHIYKDLWAISQLGTDTVERLPLSRLLEISNFASSTNPRDKVFGLLGIMPSRLADAIMVDYTVDAGSIMTQAAKAYIQVYNNLELLRDANIWGGCCAPSWAPDWTWNGRLRDRHPGEELHARVDNPNFSAEHDAERGYDASVGLTFGGVRVSGPEDRYLTCKCVFLDELDGLAAPTRAVQGYIVGPIVQSSGSRNAYGGKKETAAAISSALYANRSQSSKSSEALLHLPKSMDEAMHLFGEVLDWPRFMSQSSEVVEPFYMRWIRFLDAVGDLRLGGQPLATYFDGVISPTATYEDYHCAFQSWIRTSLGRRLGTTASGRLAWVPHFQECPGAEQAEKGDLFAVFPGCTTPILLRKTFVEADKRDVYRVLGEAYLDGMMDGEVAELVKLGELTIEEVVLC